MFYSSVSTKDQEHNCDHMFRTSCLPCGI